MKQDKLISVIKTIAKNPLPSDVMDIAKTLFHTDNMPAHEAITTAYKLSDTPIPNIHRYAIEILKKGDSPNINYWKEKIPLPEIVNPSGTAKMSRKSMVDIEDKANTELKHLIPKLGWIKRDLNKITHKGEPLVSKDYLEEEQKRASRLSKESDFINVLRALGLGW